MSGDELLTRVSPISELFRTDRVALWATTYNMDLDLFNGYLLGRLGEPPLNVVVLADRDRLDATLDSLPPERVNSLGPVNRRWLLRGVRIGSGRFHPKSYLAVTGRSVELLVGSGNLSTNGLDAGREVFTVFRAGTPHGDAAIRTWLSWMRQIVSVLDDTMLAERFSDLEARMPRTESVSVVVDSPLWHNLKVALADQFCEQVLSGTERVDELIVTAPYYDETGDALGRLLTRLAPGRVTIYTTASSQVDGTKLAARLAAADADVQAFAYLPEAFTHAKLLGAVSGNRGWLLSGSANLSNAALTFSGGPAGSGNVELAVFAALSADDLRRTFLPPETEAEERPLASLAALSFDSEPDVRSDPLIRITHATALPDGRVEITTSPDLDDTLRLSDHKDVTSLEFDGERATTSGSLAGPLVHLVDEWNRPVSNHVIIDDPESLRRVLETGDDRGARSRPAELNLTDLDTPLGQALLHLHRNVVMDVSETAGRGGGIDATREEASDNDADDDLWDRLEREKLGRDPRASTYSRLFRSASSPELSDALIELLDAMRERAPGQHSHEQTLLRTISGPIPPINPGTGRPWSKTARVRVRARNVLRRWASVQTDPRLTWVDPLAPLGNLTLVAAVFAQLWRYNAEPDLDAGLTEDDLDDLWNDWLRPFVGTGQGDGWLHRSRLDEQELGARLGGEFARNVTALCWLAIRPGPQHRQRVVRWQPAFRGVLEHNLVEVEEDTAEYLTAIGYPVSSDRVLTDILEALDFIDDDLWCAQKAAELALTHLAIEMVGTGHRDALRLMVSGIADPLNDPRVPALLTSIGQYRSADILTVVGEDHDWRLAVPTDSRIYFMSSLAAAERESVPLRAGEIEKLVVAGGVLGDLFPAAARYA